MEVWKDVDGFEGVYQVSNMGKVKRLSGIILTRRGQRKIKEKIMSTNANKTPYALVNLRYGKKNKVVKVHKLVAYHFLGSPNGLVVNHKDGNKKNNKLENLEYITHRENCTHGSKKDGHLGVYKQGRKWASWIYHKKQIYLGHFDTEAEAIDAYKKAFLDFGLENKYAGIK